MQNKQTNTANEAITILARKTKQTSWLYHKQINISPLLLFVHVILQLPPWWNCFRMWWIQKCINLDEINKRFCAQIKHRLLLRSELLLRIPNSMCSANCLSFLAHSCDARLGKALSYTPSFKQFTFIVVFV